jgi:hypothetical protein
VSDRFSQALSRELFGPGFNCPVICPIMIMPPFPFSLGCQLPSPAAAFNPLPLLKQPRCQHVSPAWQFTGSNHIPLALQVYMFFRLLLGKKRRPVENALTGPGQMQFYLRIRAVRSDLAKKGGRNRSRDFPVRQELSCAAVISGKRKATCQFGAATGGENYPLREDCQGPPRRPRGVPW